MSIATRVSPALVLTGALLLATPARAQSAQPVAFQVAALFTSIRAGGTSSAGAGVEPQLRLNRVFSGESFGAVSIGIGGQYTIHRESQDKLVLAGVFLEPRWVPAIESSRFFPYLSGRVAVMRMTATFRFADDGTSSGTAFGAGGGFAIKLTRQTNLDAGAQLIRQRFGAIGTVTFKPFLTYAAKLGLTVGFPAR
jgi:hypothetical protein